LKIKSVIFGQVKNYSGKFLTAPKLLSSPTAMKTRVSSKALFFINWQQ